jgi:Zn-dependent protease with chaperone function
MSYNNLLYFLAVLLTLSAVPPPEQPQQLAPWLALPLFALLLFLFSRLAARQFRAALRQGGCAAYFAAESRLTLLAAALFIGAVFIFDLSWHLRPLSLGGALPTLAHAGGLLLFFLFLFLMWREAQPASRKLFGCRRSPSGFAAASLRGNLPLILPWFVLSLTFDLLRLLPWPAAQQTLASSWGELLFFLVALAFLTLLFPPLASRLWGCVPLPPGPQREMIERFCRRQNFSAQILSWPLLEGRALTAAVMGIIPRFRCLLLTPALLAALDQEELEAVLAHEIGHVRKKHFLLLLLLLAAFGLLTQVLSGQLLSLLLGSGWFWRLALWSGLSAERLLEYLTGAAALALLLLCFRFLFGWFIRNFERQADLHAVQVQGGGWPLFRAFDKIAVLSGIRPEQKNWHHFGLGERMEFIVRCGHDPGGAVRQQERRLRFALAACFICVASAVLLLPQPDTDALNRLARVQQLSLLAETKLRQEPDSIRWLLLRADLLLEQGREQEALAAYEQILLARPMLADALNNLAWLLLTAKDERLRDQERALELALKAVRLEERGHIVDTLAEALWVAGRTEEAVRAAGRAAEIDPAGQAYYRSQAEKFTSKPQR